MRFLMMSLALLLSACVAPFDGHEYSRLVDARHELRESTCANEREVHAMINMVQLDVDWLRIYSRHIPDNDNTLRMLEALDKSIREMVDRYDSGQPVSVIYCRLKVRTLQDQMDIILKTTARRGR